ncbi:MAG: GDCCVxC domain-containing (seleno)protein [Pseudomonadales bacterium]
MKNTCTIICPICGHKCVELMRKDACQFFYQCKGCSGVLQPVAGDCCVFCSFGDTPCPPKQDQSERC